MTVTLFAIATIWIIGIVAIFIAKCIGIEFIWSPKCTIAICVVFTLGLLAFFLKMQVVKEIF